MEPRILYELFPPEIKKEFIQASARRAYEKGKPYTLLLQHFANKLLPILFKKIDALEKGAPPSPSTSMPKGTFMRSKSSITSI